LYSSEKQLAASAAEVITPYCGRRQFSKLCKWEVPSGKSAHEESKQASKKKENPTENPSGKPAK